jgi:predicted transcriptional regulator
MARMTVTFDSDTEKRLDNLANDLQTTKADVVARALSLYDYAARATRKGRNKLSLTDESDKVVKDLIFR